MTPIESFENKWVKPKEGRTLIVGSRLFSQREDRRKRYADAIGIDLDPGEGVDMVLDMELPVPSWMGKFAHIEILSVLEHCNRPWLLAANAESLLEEGGTIYVSVPWVWRIHRYSGDLWRMSPEAFRILFEGIDWDAIRIATNDRLWPEDQKKIPAVTVDDSPYIQRAETIGFGRKRAIV